MVYLSPSKLEMRIVEGPFWVEIEPDLLEPALERASLAADESLRTEYRQEREAVSGIETVDIREACFQDLDARWAERFGLLDALRRALIEEPALGAAVEGCVLYAARPDEEQGMLLEPDGEPTSGVLTIRVAPQTLLSLQELRRLLSDGRDAL